MVARLLFQGLPTTKIAKRIHLSTESTRDLMNTPEFLEVYRKYETEQLQVIDRAMPKLLLEALVALAKLLKHPDWRARDAAIQTIIRPHGSTLERIAGYGVPRRGGSLSDPNTVIPAEAMSDEMRQKSRELLQLSRKALPAVVARVTAIHETHTGNGHQGSSGMASS